MVRGLEIEATKVTARMYTRCGHRGFGSRVDRDALARGGGTPAAEGVLHDHDHRPGGNEPPADRFAAAATDFHALSGTVKFTAPPRHGDPHPAPS